MHHSRYIPLFSSLSSESLSQLLIHMPTVADGHQTNSQHSLIDGIDDPKATNTIFPEPIEFPPERLPTFWVNGNRTNSELDRLLQIRMERSDHFRDMRRDIRTEEVHAERRFLMGVRGSPNTSSNDSPLCFLL